MNTSLAADGRPRLRGWRAVLGHAGYPVLLFGGCALSWFLSAQGVSKMVSTTGVLVGMALLIMAMERAFAYTDKWERTGRRMRLDFFHILFTSGGASKLVEFTLLGLVVVAGSAASEAWGGSIWPSEWPLVFQVALGLLIGEFGAYWAHRLMHTSHLGWRLHAVHHSIEHMHVLASGRTHPFNTFFVFTCQSALVVFLGVTPEALALMSVFTGINGQLQHANVDLRPGLLNWVLATSDLHRWHHSKSIEEGNNNYGNNLIIWDWLFGTKFLPADKPPTTSLGITGATIPETLWDHLRTPFVYQQYEDISEG
ncbi:MAG: sterol desaturase family protein [Myxococcales bacterium]|nr:sterol desaturase family protein [Myxococcales bacterium]